MRLSPKFLSFLMFGALVFNVKAQTPSVIIDKAVFYDGYAKKVQDTLPAGLLRLRNDLITTKLSETQLEQIYDDLIIKVTISALCDNYDRIGNINLAMVPKGSATYTPDSIQR